MTDKSCNTEKYFDDGIVQYWRLASCDETFSYRITVQPSGISIDEIGLSWNRRPCWIVVTANLCSFEEARVALLEKRRKRETSSLVYKNSASSESQVSESQLLYKAA